MNLTKLLLRHLTRRAAHKVLSRTAHGKGNNLPDVFLPPQQHNHPVHARRHACMRRRAKLECIVQSAEFLFQHLLIIARNLKRLHHDIQIMVPHCPGGQLHAVAHNVVLVSQNLQWFPAV